MLPSYAANSSLHKHDDWQHSNTEFWKSKTADPYLADVAAALLLAALVLDSS